MNYQIIHKTKKRYLQPKLNDIKIDNKIALILESNPPIFESNYLDKTNDHIIESIYFNRFINSI